MKYAKGALMAVWQDKKRICIISTNGSIRVNNVSIINIYNKNMGGVDLFDQLKSNYEMKRRSNDGDVYFIIQVAVFQHYL